MKIWNETLKLDTSKLKAGDAVMVLLLHDHCCCGEYDDETVSHHKLSSLAILPIRATYAGDGRIIKPIVPTHTAALLKSLYRSSGLRKKYNYTTEERLVEDICNSSTSFVKHMLWENAHIKCAYYSLDVYESIAARADENAFDKHKERCELIAQAMLECSKVQNSDADMVTKETASIDTGDKIKELAYKTSYYDESLEVTYGTYIAYDFPAQLAKITMTEEMADNYVKDMLKFIAFDTVMAAEHKNYLAITHEVCE